MTTGKLTNDVENSNSNGTTNNTKVHARRDADLSTDSAAMSDPDFTQIQGGA